MTQALLKTAYELANSVCTNYSQILWKPPGEEEQSVEQSLQQSLEQSLPQSQEEPSVEFGVLAIPLRSGREAERRVRSYWGKIRDLDENFEDDTLYLDISKISVGALAEFLVDYRAPPHVLASALMTLEQLQDGNYNAASVQEAEEEEEEGDANKMSGTWKGSEASPGEVESRDNVFTEKMGQSLEYKPTRKRSVKDFFLRLKWRLSHATQDTNPAEGEGSEEEEGDKQFRFNPVRLLDDLRIYWYKRTHRRKPPPKAEVYTSESVTSVRKDIRRVPSLWSRTLSYVRLTRPVQFFYANIYWQ